MKKIFAIFMILFVLLASNVTYASENTLTLNGVLNDVEISNTVKLLDFKTESLYNSYLSAQEIAESFPLKIMSAAKASLSQTVVGPPITVVIMGQPITYDHTLSQSEINQILANFGFSYTKKDRLAQDNLMFLLPRNLLSNHRILEKNRDLTVDNLKLNAEELFYAILLQNQVVSLNQEIVDANNIRLENMLQKFNKGLISKKDYESFKLGVEQDLLQLQIQERTRQNLIFSLNQLTSRNISQNYDLIEGEIVRIEEPNIDLEKSILNALENRIEIYQLNEQIANKERELLFTNIHYENKAPQYLSVKYELQIARRSLEETKENIRFELEDAYQRILLNENNIKKAQIELENAIKNYDNMKSQFENGLITKDVLDLTHVSVSSANLNLLSSINTYNMSIKKFMAASGLGPAFVEGV